MDWLTDAINIFLHIDKHLADIIQQYQGWTYAILFIVIFMETGFVVTPFLPGDSLLFASGALAALEGSPLNAHVVAGLLMVAAILGDTANYWIGKYIGPHAFSGKIRFLNKKHLDRTHVFYEKHGASAIILARFVPIIRTFAPFVAGIGFMSYRKFIAYNIIGGCLWVSLFVFSGYYFGNIPVVKQHFSLVILAIMVLSVLPIVYEIAADFLQARKERLSGKKADTAE